MVTERPGAARSNRLLDLLPPRERASLASAAEAIDLVPGEVLCAAGAKIRHVYFPCQGVVLLYARARDSPDIGVGLIRSDGMFGVAAAAGQATSRLRAVSQGAGQGERIETARFQGLLQRYPAMTKALFAYAHRSAAQMAQNTACVAFHASRVRLARWMLDVTEGSRSARFSSTQAATALALGLQRPAVSNAAAGLQRLGLIEYLRGEVTILDRARLRAVACSCSIAP